ncbi:uncharacterized protein LOC143449367 [Clavelina lepadiformis]|uniref:BZIP domain-containing protein n=1 Tax=Clavelina lepadiformis TaxID=159417 RepID=A0ABP0GF08_CLALP
MAQCPKTGEKGSEEYNMSLSVGGPDRRTSPSSSRNLLLNTSSAIKKGNVLKEQTNYQLIDELWLQQKNCSATQDLQNQKVAATSQQSKFCDLYLENYVPNHSLEKHRKGVVGSNVMGVSHIPHHSNKFVSPELTESLNCRSTNLAPMRISKTYGAQHYVADISYSGLNMCGGDSPFVTAMSHTQESLEWNVADIAPQSRPVCSEGKYEVQRQQMIKDSYSEEINDKHAADMSVREILKSATAHDINQHGVSGSAFNQAADKSKGHLPIEQRTVMNRNPKPLMSGDSSKDVFNTPETIRGKEQICNANNYKHDTWGHFETPGLIEHHVQPQVVQSQSYISTYSSNSRQSTLPSNSTSSYDLNTSLLKDHSLRVKQEPQPMQQAHLPIMWDKRAFDREQYYLKPPPVDLEDLSDDERERMRVKRERNRVAAAKCRNRRRELLERLEKEAEQLEREQEVLRDNVKRLQAQKRKLGSMLDKHEPACANKLEDNVQTTFEADSDATEQNIGDQAD